MKILEVSERTPLTQFRSEKTIVSHLRMIDQIFDLLFSERPDLFFGKSGNYTTHQENDSLETVIAMTLVVRDAVQLQVVCYVVVCWRRITAAVVAASGRLRHVLHSLWRCGGSDLCLVIKRKYCRKTSLNTLNTLFNP